MDAVGFSVSVRQFTKSGRCIMCVFLLDSLTVGGSLNAVCFSVSVRQFYSRWITECCVSLCQFDGFKVGGSLNAVFLCVSHTVLQSVDH